MIGKYTLLLNTVITDLIPPITFFRFLENISKKGLFSASGISKARFL